MPPPLLSVSLRAAPELYFPCPAEHHSMSNGYLILPPETSTGPSDEKKRVVKSVPEGDRPRWELTLTGTVEPTSRRAISHGTRQGPMGCLLARVNDAPGTCILPPRQPGCPHFRSPAPPQRPQQRRKADTGESKRERAGFCDRRNHGEGINIAPFGFFFLGFCC